MTGVGTYLGSVVLADVFGNSQTYSLGIQVTAAPVVVVPSDDTPVDDPTSGGTGTDSGATTDTTTTVAVEDGVIEPVTFSLGTVSTDGLVSVNFNQ